MTPLLAALLAEKNKESIQRNHAHYASPAEFGATRKQLELAKKEEALEFSRAPEKAKTAGEASSKKQKGGGKVPPSPARKKDKAPKGEASSAAEPGVEGAEGVPPPNKGRPKFKFDAALGGSIPSKGPGPSQGENVEGSSGQVNQDGPPKKAKKPKPPKEKKPPVGGGDGAPVRLPRAAGGSQQGTILAPAPKILQRPVPMARIDDFEEFEPPASSSPPRTPIQTSPRGRGKWGRGRGRGSRGRGAAPIPTDIP